MRYLRPTAFFKYLPNCYIVMHEKLRCVCVRVVGDNNFEIARRNITGDITCIEAKQTQFRLAAKLKQWHHLCVFPHLVYCRSGTRSRDSVRWLLLRKSTHKALEPKHNEVHTLNTLNKQDWGEKDQFYHSKTISQVLLKPDHCQQWLSGFIIKKKRNLT